MPPLHVLALIPARGGSKGIPRKNVLVLDGKPLIAYSIEHARASRRISRVLVSTDDEEIARVARDWGAEVPFIRPDDLATDLSPDIDVFRHALDWLADREGYRPDLVVHLRPTGPIRQVELVDEAIDRLQADPSADAIRSVSVALQTPYKMWRLMPDGRMEPALRVEGLTDAQSRPRQQLPVVYWQNGYVDVLRPRAIFEKGSMWGDRVLPFLVDEALLDLDYPDDIPAVEAALRQFRERGTHPSRAVRGHSV
jgi:N-acylneuraminate cytidylyltransferase